MTAARTDRRARNDRGAGMRIVAAGWPEGRDSTGLSVRKGWVVGIEVGLYSNAHLREDVLLPTLFLQSQVDPVVSRSMQRCWDEDRVRADAEGFTGAERIRVSRAEASGKFPFQCRTTRDRLADEVEQVRPNDWREPRRGVRWERGERTMKRLTSSDGDGWGRMVWEEKEENRQWPPWPKPRMPPAQPLLALVFVNRTGVERLEGLGRGPVFENPEASLVGWSLQGLGRRQFSAVAVQSRKLCPRWSASGGVR